MTELTRRDAVRFGVLAVGAAAVGMTAAPRSIAEIIEQNAWPPVRLTSDDIQMPGQLALDGKDISMNVKWVEPATGRYCEWTVPPVQSSGHAVTLARQVDPRRLDFGMTKMIGET